MKTKTFFFVVFTGLFSLVTTHTFAQNNQNAEEQKLERQAAKTQAGEDERRLSDAISLNKDAQSDAKTAKANSKEANRIEGDATDAAKQAKQAVRTEERAQKSRINADKQAKKAAKASEKSNNN
jgi:hypothetical protein